MTHNFQYGFSLKATLSRHLFINHERSFADKVFLLLPSPWFASKGPIQQEA